MSKGYQSRSGKLSALLDGARNRRNAQGTEDVLSVVSHGQILEMSWAGLPASPGSRRAQRSRIEDRRRRRVRPAPVLDGEHGVIGSKRIWNPALSFRSLLRYCEGSRSSLGYFCRRSSSMAFSVSFQPSPLILTIRSLHTRSKARSASSSL